MNKKQGFTLIELLVVIAIIGILSSVVLASLNTARQKARDAKRISDVKNIQLALELYFDTNSEYPDTLAALAAAKFIPAEPAGPLTSETYYYNNFSDSSLLNDCAISSGSCLYYHLGADLEQSGHSALNSDDDADDVNTITNNGDDLYKCNSTTDNTRYCYDVTS
jgi:type II secretion system protein G